MRNQLDRHNGRFLGHQHAVRLQIEQFHQAGRSNLGLHGSLRHGILAHGEFRLRTIGVGLVALSAAGEGGRQFGQLFRVVERLLRNGLLLERPQEVEVSHGHEQQEVMGGGRGRVLPGRHLLACDARLENRIRHGELGRHARESPAHRRRPRTSPVRLPMPSGWPTVIVPSLFCNGPSWFW